MSNPDSESEWDSPEMRRAAMRLGFVILSAASEGQLCFHLPSMPEFNEIMHTLEEETDGE